MWRHPQRVPVLAALALLARDGADWIAGLRRLAEHDPLLARWRDRLVPELEAGADPIALLRRRRLIDRHEAEWLDQRRVQGRFAAALGSVARGDRRRPRWTAWFVTWYPLWLLAGVLLVPFLLVRWMSLMSGGHPVLVLLDELGIYVPDDYEFLVFGPFWLALPTLLLVLAVAALALSVIERVPWLRLLPWLWSAGVRRELAAIRLIEEAEQGQRRGRGWSERIAERVVGLGPESEWRWQWRTWWWQMRWWMPRPIRLGLAHDGAHLDPTARLRSAGVLTQGERGVDWDASWAAARLRLEAAVARRLGWYAIVGLGATLWMIMSFSMGPLIEIVVQLSSFGVVGMQSLADAIVGRYTIALAVAIGGAWIGLALLPAPTPRRMAIAALLAAIARAVGQRRPLADELLVTASALPWWQRFALRRTIDRLQSGDRHGENGSAIAACARTGLLPPRLVAEGLAAEALGPDALRRWCLERGQRRGAAHRFPVTTTLVGVEITTAAAILTFVTIFILPKFEQIFDDLGIELEAPVFSVLVGIGGWWFWILLVALVAVMALRSWWYRTIVWSRRMGRAALLQLGTQRGLSEERLADALTDSLSPRRVQRVQEAAALGDWRAMAAACGWRVRDADDLGRRYDRARRRRAWWGELIAAAGRVAIPLILAVPVFWLVHLIFGTLVGLLVELS